MAKKIAKKTAKTVEKPEEKDWRSLPRKGKGLEKRDKSFGVRIPQRYYDYWLDLATADNRSLSDWIFNELSKKFPLSEKK